jgi:hypothetical protein
LINASGSLELHCSGPIDRCKLNPARLFPISSCVVQDSSRGDRLRINGDFQDEFRALFLPKSEAADGALAEGKELKTSILKVAERSPSAFVKIAPPTQFAGEIEIQSLAVYN